jgi:hypothetical protein
MGNLPGPTDWDVLENGDKWGTCNFFVERNQYSASAERTLQEMRTSSRLWYRNRIGIDSYGSKHGRDRIPLLQVADLGAFLVAKRVSDSGEGRISWRNYYERIRAAGRIHGIGYLRGDFIGQLSQTLKEMKQEEAGRRPESSPSGTASF